MKKKITSRNIAKILFPVFSTLPLGVAWLAAELGKSLEVLILLTLCIVLTVGLPTIFICFNISKIVEMIEERERELAKKDDAEQKIDEP